jgi:hypothetical protein
MSITLELDEAVIVTALKSNLTFGEYRLLSEWLDCYNYVLPNDRGLSTKFLNSVCQTYFISPTDIYALWMKSNLIHTTLTVAKQVSILSWMAQKNLSHL